MTSREETRLTDEVASLVRVRNRLSKSSDHQLPKILSALIPKLLKRLEGSLVVPSHESPRCKELTILAQEHMNGILGHGLERFRGNHVPSTSGILNGILPFLKSSNNVSATWALIYVQAGIAQCTTETLPTETSPTLIQSMDKLHAEVTAATTKTSLARLTSASWLFLDCVIMSAGLRPLIDWDLDFFDEKCLQWEVQKSDSWDRLASEEAVAAASEDGAAVFHLFLDLLLFWPTELAAHSGLSVDGEARISHCNRITDQERRMTRMQHRGQRRIVVTNKWSDMAQAYLRQLKLIGLRYAIWPRDRGLFRTSNSDRALVLAILFASENSMHGRLAADFINNVRSNRNLRKQQNGPFLTLSTVYSFEVACTLLIFLVGDQRAIPLLQAFEEKNGHSPWIKIIGKIPTTESRQRPPLPSSVAGRAVSFLLDHNLHIDNDGNFKAKIHLLVHLTLLLATRPEGDRNLRSSEERKLGKFWAVQLIQAFLDHVLPAPATTRVKLDEWTLTTMRSCLDVAVEVTSIVVEIGSSNVEQPRSLDFRQLPGGVQAPFHQRQDLSRMLNIHRATQKRRKLGECDAIRARQIAYGIIATTASQSIQREKKPFELPIYLLRCSIYEDDHMQSCVSKASTALLEVYKDHIEVQDWHRMSPEVSTDGSVSSLEQLAVPLLPAILDAVCSDSSYARLLAIEWIQHFLRWMDIEAAWYLVQFLCHDPDSQVSLKAKSVLTSLGSPPDPPYSGHLEFDYVDSSSESGLKQLKSNLKSCLQTLSVNLGAEVHIAEPLLFDFRFDTEELISQFAVSRHLVLEKNGLMPAASDQSPIQAVEKAESCCGICYDEIDEHEAFGLECGHEFCRQCWAALVDAVGSEQKYGYLSIRCPQQDCACRVLPRHLQSISLEACRRWDEQYFAASVEFDSSCCACPGTNCQYIAVVKDDDKVESTALCMCPHCDTSFCFGCAEEPHQPAPCKAIAEWNRIQTKSDFWVRKNSKPCPGCHAPIEKAQGCNHIICTCGVQFCWLCLTPLQRHSENHTCNRYDPTNDATNDYERRALFVAERFEAHLQAQHFAENQHKNMIERPKKLIELFCFLNEDDEATLMEGILTLCEARKFLRNSYVASFGFRKDPKQLNTLENYQSALEMLTERLSQLTETNLQRLYLEKGENGLKGHFHGLGFYRLSVSNYMDRFNAALSKSVLTLHQGLIEE